MPVAKTFAKYEIQGEVFREKGTKYVNVVTPKGLKKVRWYSDAEYNRMYASTTPNNNKGFNARYAFGFRDEGFITLYKGNEEAIKDWAQDVWPPKAWYNLFFRFFTPGFMPVENVPEGITPIRLNWSEVAAEGNTMKPHEEVQKIVSSYIDDITKSRYQGEIDEWLQKTVTIREKTSKESKFGTKHTYVLEDSEGNLYVWETGAKDFANSQTVSLKMKVKEHKEDKGNKVTVVWYCKEV